MSPKLHLAILAAGFATLAVAQERHEINFPDIPGYHTLKCDLHTHTVFSDGLVWPTVRLNEAWRLGLDVLAITDHIEYQPHKDDIPTNHNRPFELVQGKAKEKGILLPKGTEITRETPPGHFNAIFLDDVDPIETDSFVDAVKHANDQGAFVFWNHQGWKGEKLGRWMDVHTTLYKNKWLHGMEVANGGSYYPDAHQWCLDRGLTMLGNSDIHDPDLNERTTSESHRTMTLVFAKERTLEGLKEALMAGRTVVWHKDQLIGRKKWLRRLIRRSVHASAIRDGTGEVSALRLKNDSDVAIHLVRVGEVGPEELHLSPGNYQRVKVKSSEGQGEMHYTAVNLLIAPGEGLPVTLVLPGGNGKLVRVK